MSTETRNSDTETAIKTAAKSIFLKKGLAGTRLQEIADAAGIGRTALHYYFRSKENLFEVVFSESFEKMRQRINAFALSDAPIVEMMKMFVSDFYDMAAKGPEIDLFLINEFNQNPDTMNKVLCQGGGVTHSFMKCIEKAVEKGELKGDPLQIMITLISVCAHPFAARAMLMNILDISEERYAKILCERKAFVYNFLETAFKP